MFFIKKKEFLQRIKRIREIMKKKKLDVCIIFGDEYRREYIRYAFIYL